MKEDKLNQGVLSIGLSQENKYMIKDEKKYKNFKR
jgi:hypothetical protein